MATPKKPAKKAVPATKKTASTVKKTVSPAKKEEAAKKPRSILDKYLPKKAAGEVDLSKKTKKTDYVRKPITVVQKKPKIPLKRPEEPTEFNNNSQSLAYLFAERMKQNAREVVGANESETTDIKLSRRPTTRARGQETLQFPEADLVEFRKRLILLRQEALGQSASLRTNALEHTDDRGSEDDDGSDAFLRLQNLSQVNSQNKVIQKIDEALHRIDEGSYGICEVCGQLIRKPRLLNLPFVHTCMECQNQMENPYGRG